jgi:probable O-glycosylation ligase (exosortase A-associated)
MAITPALYLILYCGFIFLNFLKDVSWGIYLYQINYFFFPSNRWWGSSIPGFLDSFLISILILVSFSVRWQQYSKTPLFSAPQAKWLLMFFIFMCVASFYAVWPEKHYEYLEYQIKLMIIIGIAYKVIDSTDKFEKLIFFYILGIFYLGWEAYSTGRTAFYRLDGIGMIDGTDANDTAVAMITAVPLLFFYLVTGKIWQKAVSLFALTFILNGIVLINSRGSFLGLVGGCGYMAWLFFVSRGFAIREKLKVLSGIIIAVCLFFYLTDNAFWDRMFTLKEIQQDVAAGETTGRMYFWGKAVDLAHQYPLGTGVSGFTYLSPQFLPEEMLTGGMRAVHSTYFQVLAEYGYLGLMLLSCLLLSNYTTLKKLRKQFWQNGDKVLYWQTVSIEASFVSYLIGIMFLDKLYAVVFYWLMVIIACFYNINRNKPV